MRKYFKKILTWTEINENDQITGYTVSLKPKSSLKFTLFKIKRINLEQKEAITLLGKNSDFFI